MDAAQELGHRIREARVAQKMSVVEAAKKANIARDTWKKIEAGQSVQDPKRQAALEAVGLVASGWVDVPQDHIDTRPMNPDDPIDLALQGLQAAAADLVRAENEFDALMRAWARRYIVEERLSEARESLGRPLSSEEVENELRVQPTAGEIAEMIAWSAMHDAREWTRLEMALIEWVFDDYPKDVRVGSAYADLEPFRERVRRLRPTRASEIEVRGGDGNVQRLPATNRPADSELSAAPDELPAAAKEGVIEEPGEFNT